MSFVIPAIVAGLGVISNLIGESAEEKRNKQRRKQIEAILKQLERERIEAQQNKLLSDRNFSGLISDRRTATNQKLSQYGMMPTGSIASNEEDLIEANIKDKYTIDALFRERERQLQNTVDMINADFEEEPSFLSNAIGGALKGFNLGMNIHGALKGLKNDNQGDNTQSNIKSNIKSNMGVGSYYPRISYDDRAELQNYMLPIPDYLKQEWTIDENGQLKRLK